ncbi:hypothetical protein KKF91_14410 [Myxococcota bacterium]|nr:hypothetical protein [Myxococcota bacterium]MBU1431734.1 hypothetical protein [Myxococcota bacterium]MBU1898780.1 hypothetical protein [Myxococcota bacterium]
MFEPSAFEFFVAIGVAGAVGFLLGGRRTRSLNAPLLEPTSEEEEILISVEIPQQAIKPPSEPPLKPGFEDIDFAEENEEERLPDFDEPIEGISAPRPFPGTEETHIEALRIEIEALKERHARDRARWESSSVDADSWAQERAELEQTLAHCQADAEVEIARLNDEVEVGLRRHAQLKDELEGLIALDPLNLETLIGYYEAERHKHEIDLKTQQQILMEEAPIELPSGEADVAALAHAAAEQRRQDEIQARIQEDARLMRRAEAILNELKNRRSPLS